MAIETSEAIHRRVAEIVAELQAVGLGAAAERLSRIQTTVYTTGSEWQGELRSAVRLIRRARGIPSETDRKLKRLLAPSFSERVVERQLWQGILAGTLMAILGGAVVALVTAGRFERLAPFWITGAVVLTALLWIAVRRVSVCPGCGTRIRQRSPGWCPYCGTHLAGSTGPQISALPALPRSTLLECPKCGNPPGGLGRYGARFPSEGHFCSFCGARLPA